jgi:hypothetical protein
MMRDQAFGSKSEQAVDGTSIDDLNKSSLETYRNQIRNDNRIRLTDEDMEVAYGEFWYDIDGSPIYVNEDELYRMAIKDTIRFSLNKESPIVDPIQTI